MLELHLDDFDAYKIAQSGQCFRMRVQPDGSVFAMAGAHAVALWPLKGGGWRFSCERQMFDSFWRPYFDLDADYARYRARAYRKDSFLQQAFLEGAGLRILRQDAWETLVSFIISQRKSIPAISTAVEALCRACGQPVQEEPGVYAFPSAQTLAQKDEAFLRACGLGYRAPYVLDAAKRVASGRLDLAALGEKKTPALCAALQQVHGVGEKVALCVALFGYHRLEACPVDVWMRRVLDTQYGGAMPTRYRACAGVLQQYLFCLARSRRLR